MNILYLLVAVSLFAALTFLVLFIWAVKSGQYEDTFSSSVRILFDDEDSVVVADKTQGKGKIKKKNKEEDKKVDKSEEETKRT